MPSPHTLLVSLTLAAALAIAAPAAAAAEPVTLTHVHGLSYSADGTRLMIPSHHGLAVFESAGKPPRWSKAPGPAHDYMGFAATRDALYSSGHPAPDAGLVNPFGLIKSIDGGKTWKKLGMEGESDFHLLATGYATNAVYVVNHGPNSRMNQPGLYHTRDDGASWTRAAAKGVSGEPKAIAVHPSDARTVAVGTSSGLYLSRDAGDSFQRLVGGADVLGVAFDVEGKHLWFGTYAGKARLSQIVLSSGAKARELPIPALQDDAVAYIAHNPARRGEIAIASFRRTVFLSQDAGQTWKPIATNGVTQD